MSTPLLEAFELLAHSRDLARRLEAAAAELAKRPGLAEEKAWLESGRTRLNRAREGIGDLLDRALRLEELESMRGGRARELQGEVVDALERLSAGIAFAGGPRSPLNEALFFNTKLPTLRKLEREEFERAWRELEKRLASGYAKRMLADETYLVVKPALDEALQAYRVWQTAFEPTPLSEAEASALCEELVATAHRVDLPSRQARLLAQAALLSMKEILDEHGLTPKPKRRGAPDPDTHPLLEQNPPDPPDPNAPTPEEQAELEGLRAPSDAIAKPDTAAKAAKATVGPDAAKASKAPVDTDTAKAAKAPADTDTAKAAKAPADTDSTAKAAKAPPAPASAPVEEPPVEAPRRTKRGAKG